MPKGIAPVAALIVDLRDIEVRIGKRFVELQCDLVHQERFVEALQFFAYHPEIEMQHGVRGVQ